MRRPLLVSVLLAPLHYALHPALLLALLLHIAFLAIPLAASPEADEADDPAPEQTTAETADFKLGEDWSDFPALAEELDDEQVMVSPEGDGEPPLGSPAAGSPTPLLRTPAVPVAQGGTPARATPRGPVGQRTPVTRRSPAPPRASAPPPPSSPPPSEPPAIVAAPPILEPEPPAELAIAPPTPPSPSDPFASLPPYSQAQAGSLARLQPDLEGLAFHTPDEIEQVLAAYAPVLAQAGFTLASNPELQADDFQVHRLTATADSSEPRYLHLLRHEGHTILVVAPEPLPLEQLLLQE